MFSLYLFILLSVFPLIIDWTSNTCWAAPTGKVFFCAVHGYSKTTKRSMHEKLTCLLPKQWAAFQSSYFYSWKFIFYFYPSNFQWVLHFDFVTDFLKAFKRIVTNKILIVNTWSGILYIIGASGFITYMVKYLEVQFQKSAAESSKVTG